MTADFGRTHIIADFKIRQRSKTFCILLFFFEIISQNKKLIYPKNSSLNKVLLSDKLIENNLNILYVMSSTLTY